MNDDLDAAVQFALAHETPWSREVGDRFGIHQHDAPPWNRLLGPQQARGGVAGCVLRDGRVLAEFGEARRPDLTFSIAKTYLALLAGVAHDRGLLGDVDAPVRTRVPGIGFESPQNAPITWTHLLQQTSEWEGVCFDVPDQVDRYRLLPFQEVVERGRKGDARPLRPPGTFFEYNDVRINQLALALLHVFRRPLPEVFAEAAMGPVGATEPWRWTGYDNAWVEVPGLVTAAAQQRLQSVPGGSHWGGGVAITAVDQARIAQMMLDDGRVGARVVISREWLTRMRTPCPIAPFYGYLLWLNAGRRVYPSTPEGSDFAIGAGTSLVWTEPSRRLVVVIRWIDGGRADEFFGRVLAAVDS